MDIRQTLNSCDSFPRRKFKNWAQISCSPGPTLSPPTISFEFHAKTAEEIDLEKCNFHNLGSSVTLTLERVEVTLVRICGRGLPTHEIRWKLEKRFLWTDIPEFQSTRSSPGNDLKIEWWGAGVVARCKWLDMVQLIRFHWHSVVSCFIKIQTGLTFLVPAYPGCRGKEAVSVKQVCLSIFQLLAINC